MSMREIGELQKRLEVNVNELNETLRRIAVADLRCDVHVSKAVYEGEYQLKKNGVSIGVDLSKVEMIFSMF